MKKENIVGEKIRQAMKEAGLTQRKLADKLGITNPVISVWITGKRNPKPDTLRRIASATGKPFSFFAQEYRSNEYVQSIEATPLTPTNTVTLPILADVPAGLPDYSDRDVEFFHSIPRNMFPGADFIIRCIGDSLSPKFNLGDYCVIRKTTDPMHGRAMIVKTENGICMKVINKTKDGVQLCSLNKKYKPFYPKELKIIGLIIGHWSRDDKENLLGSSERI